MISVRRLLERPDLGTNYNDGAGWTVAVRGA